jgi:hypothetical protein
MERSGIAPVKPPPGGRKLRDDPLRSKSKGFTDADMMCFSHKSLQIPHWHIPVLPVWVSRWVFCQPEVGIGVQPQVLRCSTCWFLSFGLRFPVVHTFRSKR